MIDPLLKTYARNLKLANSLVADLDDEAMVVQPAANMNHAAWVIGHLTATCDVAMRALGEPRICSDEWRDRFGPRSTPINDLNVYPGKQALLDSLSDGHEQIAAIVQHIDEKRWLGPPADERQQKRWDTLGQALLHVMVSHEQMHLGQVSAWRRVQGLPAV